MRSTFTLGFGAHTSNSVVNAIDEFALLSIRRRQLDLSPDNPESDLPVCILANEKGREKTNNNHLTFVAPESVETTPRRSFTFQRDEGDERDDPRHGRISMPSLDVQTDDAERPHSVNCS